MVLPAGIAASYSGFTAENAKNADRAAQLPSS